MTEHSRPTLILGLLVGGLCTWTGQAQSFSHGLPRHIITSTPQYEPDAWVHGRERFGLGARIYVVSRGERRLVAPGLNASADPRVSYDGTRVLFAGRRTAADQWNIWEALLLDGSTRQISDCNAGCIAPLYLPDGRIVYTRQLGRENVIEVADPDGSHAEPLTFAPGLYLTNEVLQDGRILFEAARPASLGSRRELFTIFPDGTGVESLRCDHRYGQSQARQLASGDVIFESNGKLARIRSSSVLQAEEPLPEGVVGPIAELTPNRWIVSIRDRGAERVRLFVWETNERRLIPVAAPAVESAVQPAIVASRTPPRQFPSALHEPYRGATVLGLQAVNQKPQSDRDALWIRVYSQNIEGVPIDLGRAKVFDDGSFYVRVPGDRPLRFELATGDGRLIRAERNWIWLRTGEQRICTGCHAGPEQAPSNRVPDAIRGGRPPVVLTAVEALTRPAP